MTSCTLHPGLCVKPDGHAGRCEDPSGGGWQDDRDPRSKTIPREMIPRDDQ